MIICIPSMRVLTFIDTPPVYELFSKLIGQRPLCRSIYNSFPGVRLRPDAQNKTLIWQGLPSCKILANTCAPYLVPTDFNTTDAGRSQH